MSQVKEANFFIGEDLARSLSGPGADMVRSQSVIDESAYRSMFHRVDGRFAYGESSPRYLATPGTAERIRNHVPDVKLIAILRNPVQRFLSEFALRVRDGWEPCKTVEDALSDEPRRMAENWAICVYSEHGYYARHLREYYRCFPSTQLKVFLYEDLVDRPDTMFRELFSFIGVDPSFSPVTATSLNVSGVIKNPFLRFLWTRSNPLKDLLRPIFPAATRRHISEFFISQDKDRLVFPMDVRTKLLKMYRDDILELQSLIGHDLTSWLAIDD